MLLIFDNLVEPTKGVHGVVVTHLLAKEELRVRFSLDALQLSGCGKAWLLRVLREHEIVGSNPFDHPHVLEDIRPDEGAVLKTAGANRASGFESLVFRFD